MEFGYPTCACQYLTGLKKYFEIMYRFGSDSAISHFTRCTEYHKCNRRKEAVTTVKLKKTVSSQFWRYKTE